MRISPNMNRVQRAGTMAIAQLLWILLGTSASVHAQNADVMDLGLEELKHVQVYSASMYMQSDRDAPSSVTVITAEQIRQFGYRTLGDALRSVRGFDITYDRNYTSIGVRGFSRPGGYNDQVLLLVNGHRLNDNIYNSAQLGSEFPLDIDLVQRIEIVRGPTSSLYGTSALLAVINVITKDRQAIDGVELSGDAGAFGTYRVRSTYGGSYHGIESLLSGSFYNSDGQARLFFAPYNAPATNNGIAVNADRDSSRDFFAAFNFGHFSLSALGSRREKGIPTASFEQVFNDNRSETVDSTGFINLEYQHPLARSAELTASVYFDRALYHGVYIYPPDRGYVDNVVEEDVSHGDCWGFNTRVAKTLWQKHRMLIGADFRDNIHQFQANYDSNPFGFDFEDHRSSLEWAFYGQDEFKLAKSLILNACLRHDQYETFGGTTNPRVALIYSPRRRTTLKLLYGQAFRAPSVYELYYQDRVSQESHPSLRPERIRTQEIIWEQDVKASIRMAVSGFANQFTDLISQQTDPRNRLIVFNNVQGVHSQGIEMELFGKTRSGIEGRASYTTQAVNPSIIVGLTGSASQIVKANLAIPFARRRLSLGLELQAIDSRTTLTGAKVGAYAISNLTVTTREFAGGFRLSASVYNVFNTPYHDPVGAEIRGSVVEQNGRDFRIQLLRAFSFR